MAKFEAISNEHFQNTEHLQIYDSPISSEISYQPLDTQHSKWDNPVQFGLPSLLLNADNFATSISEMGVQHDSLNESIFSPNIQSSLDPVAIAFNQFLPPFQMLSETFANLDHGNGGIAARETFTQEGENHTFFDSSTMLTRSQWPAGNNPFPITFPIQNATGCGWEQP
jgi:hypothetical protein